MWTHETRDVKDGYPELLGLADAAVRVDVGYVDWGVPLVASDPAANAHAQWFSRIFPSKDKTAKLE